MGLVGRGVILWNQGKLAFSSHCISLAVTQGHGLEVVMKTRPWLTLGRAGGIPAIPGPSFSSVSLLFCFPILECPLLKSFLPPSLPDPPSRYSS